MRLKLSDAGNGTLPHSPEPPVDRRLWLYAVHGEPCVHVERIDGVLPLTDCGKHKNWFGFRR